jgi:hypothetical protein
MGGMAAEYRNGVVKTMNDYCVGGKPVGDDDVHAWERKVGTGNGGESVK